MKKTKFFVVILLLVIGLTFCLNTNVLGSDIMPISETGELTNGEEGNNNNNQTNDNEVTPHEDHNIHEGDLYIVAKNREYVMDQMVDGNVFIFANTVKVTGAVNGSLFICASSIEIDKEAYVACPVYVIADEIVVNGMILDMYSLSNTLKLGESATIYRQMIASASKMELSGIVGRDAFLYGEDVNVADKNFTVYGNLSYEAKNEIANKDKLNVEGETKFKAFTEKEESVGDIILEYVFSGVGTVAFDIILYLCLLFLAPKFVNKAKEYVSTRGLLAFAIGLAFFVIVPIISLLFLMTGILGGLGVFAIFIYGAILMINAFVVVVIANEFIADKFKVEDKFKKGLILIPVSLVLWALRKIPVIGMWISIIVCLCGVGVVLLYQFDKRKEA